MKSFEIEKCPLEGSNLIEASAGTGKTSAITGLFLRLILEKKLRVEEILVVTFTVAATEELRGRIRTLLRDALSTVTGENSITEVNGMLRRIIEKTEDPKEAVYILREALLNFDRASISTIHSFCQGILLENAFESGSMYDTALDTESSEVPGRIVDDFWRIYIATASEITAAFLLDLKISREALISLVIQSDRDPGVRIVPEVEKPETERAETVLWERFNGLKDLWKRESRSVIDIIAHDPAIKRTKYRSSTVDKLIQDTRIFMAGENPVPVPKNFERLSSGTLSENLKSGHPPPKHRYFDLAQEFMGSYTEMSELLSRYIIFLKSELLRFAERERETFNRRYNIRSYQDLIREVDRSLQGDHSSPLSRAVRKRYRAALIDEFQDTDSAQYRIFSGLFGSGSILFLIGDPKQAIYGFRGGDVFAYMNAQKSVERRYTLGTNWRSERKLVTACNTLFGRNRDPFLYREIDFPPVDTPDKEQEKLTEEGREVPAFHIRFLKNSRFRKEEGDSIGKMEAEDFIARSVAMEIYRLVSSGASGKILIGKRPLKPEDIAVLVRKKSQGVKIEGYLSGLGIPGVLYGTESVFRSPEAISFRHLLSALAEPSNERLVKTALSTPFFGYSGNRILEMSRDEKSWNGIMNSFQEYQGIWANYDFITMFNTLMQREGTRSTLLVSSAGERGLTNILHIAELLHRTESSESPGHRGLIKWLTEKIHRDRGDENQLRLESDGNAVSLITIHRSKGLEFPVVFSPYTWEGVNTEKNDFYRFHDEDSGNSLVMDIGSGSVENLIRAKKEELAENIRLMYVALTRARNACYFYWGRINRSESSAPAYLLHGDEIDHKDPVSSLESIMKSTGSKEMLKQLENLVKDSEGSMDLELPEPESLHGNYRTRKDPSHLRCGEFQGVIRRSWRVSSYSSLVSSRHREYGEIKDRDLPSTWEDRRGTGGEYSIFTFPRGTVAGSLLHEVLEKADFKDPGSPDNYRLIESVLQNYRFDPEWREPVARCLEDTVNAVLDPDNPDLTLRRIDSGRRLNELEFCFPVENISPELLEEILSDIPVKGRILKIPGLDFQKSTGFIRGFIDMVFAVDGVYSIVDWKSNYLGRSPEDYGTASLAGEMESNLYTLQYHLYTLSLHRYLTLRDPGYSYEESFGSVYYLFLRGVKGKSSSGVFSHRPEERIINALEEKICGGPLK